MGNGEVGNNFIFDINAFSTTLSSVRSGMKLSRESQHRNALKAYQHALDIDGECVDALIGMGASYVSF